MDAAAVKVKLRIPDPCFGLFYRSLRCALIAGPLINVLNRSSITLLQIFGARKLSFCQFEMRRRNTELGCRLRQRDLVRLRIDREEKISFMNDVAVFEKYACKCAPNLSAYFDL